MKQLTVGTKLVRKASICQNVVQNRKKKKQIEPPPKKKNKTKKTKENNNNNNNNKNKKNKTEQQQQQHKSRNYNGHTVITNKSLRTVPTFVTAHTFYASREYRVSLGWCLLIQGYFVRFKTMRKRRNYQVF